MKWIFTIVLLLACSSGMSQEVSNPFDVQTVVNVVDGRFHVNASYSIPMSLCSAFAFLIDYEGAKMIPGIVESRVISRAGNKARVHRVVEEQILFVPISIQSVIEYTESPNKQLIFEQISGDSKLYRGTWKLAPDKDRTLFRYEALIEPDSSIPNLVIEYFMKHSIRNRFELMAERAYQKKLAGSLACN